MKTRKIRFLSALLALAMLFALVPTAAFAADDPTYTPGDFEYTVSNDTVTITKYNGSAAVVVIPGEIDDKPVTAIGSQAFNENTNITKVTIPASVTEIEDGQREFVNGTWNVYGAFYRCANLSEVVLESGSRLQKIGDYAFYFCFGGLNKINLENATELKSIGKYAFCNNLLEIVTLPQSLTEIGEKAFSSCDITEITIPATVTSMGEGCFSGCDKLKEVTFAQGIDLKAIEARAFDNTALNEIVIPKSVEKIGSAAFVSCEKLKKVEFEQDSQLKTIENKAFLGCKALTTITIPKSVTTIGVVNEEGVFKNCTVLQTVFFEPGSQLTTLEKNTFAYCNNLQAVYYDGTNSSVIEALSSLKTTTGEDIWKTKTWKVIFDSNGGSEIAQQNVKNGQKATKPDNPTREGYTFGGWYTKDTEGNYNTEAFDFEHTPITADTTLYAKWLLNATPLAPATPITYKVTVTDGTARVLDENGNEVVKTGESVEVQVGKTVTIKANDFSDSNMKFDRWEVRKGNVTLANDHAAETTFTMPAGEVELAAMLVTADTEDSGWDTATVVTGVAIGTGMTVLAYHIGMEVYAEQVLGKDVAVPRTRAEVALLAWELAGKPEVAMEGEPLSEAAQAEKWAVESGLMQPAKDGGFAPDKKLSKFKALRVLDAAKKM